MDPITKNLKLIFPENSPEKVPGNSPGKLPRKFARKSHTLKASFAVFSCSLLAAGCLGGSARTPAACVRPHVHVRPRVPYTRARAPAFRYICQKSRIDFWTQFSRFSRIARRNSTFSSKKVRRNSCKLRAYIIRSPVFLATQAVEHKSCPGVQTVESLRYCRPVNTKVRAIVAQSTRNRNARTCAMAHHGTFRDYWRSSQLAPVEFFSKKRLS